MAATTKSKVIRAKKGLAKAQKEGIAAVDVGMRKTMTKTGLILKSEIQSRAPVDTGRLRGATYFEIVTENGKPAVYVGFGEATKTMARRWRSRGFVALFIEFGTRKKAARPFVRPSYLAVKEKIKAMVRTDMGRVVRNMGKGP